MTRVKNTRGWLTCRLLLLAVLREAITRRCLVRSVGALSWTDHGRLNRFHGGGGGDILNHVPSTFQVQRFRGGGAKKKSELPHRPANLDSRRFSSIEDSSNSNKGDGSTIKLQSGGGGGRGGIDRSKPILVVGATGRVGRLVVHALLAQNRPIRAVVRDKEKFSALFGKILDRSPSPHIKVIQADLGRLHEYKDVLEEAVAGCGAIISVMGATRFSKLSDFLPWRILNPENIASWAGHDHPYYGNYLGQVFLLSLAEKYGVQRFVRLTGLGLAYSPFNPFTLLFNTLLSLNNRWGLLCEQSIVKGSVPYVILRPGGLAEDERDVLKTHVQVEPSGKLPFPGRIGRSDVAQLAVAALDLPPEASYTLACRWCGEGIKPKPQGSKDDGFSTASECLQHLVYSKARALPAPEMKPYASAVFVAVITFAYVVLIALWGVLQFLLSLKSVRGI